MKSSFFPIRDGFIACGLVLLFFGCSADNPTNSTTHAAGRGGSGGSAGTGATAGSGGTQGTGGSNTGGQGGTGGTPGTGGSGGSSGSGTGGAGTGGAGTGGAAGSGTAGAATGGSSGSGAAGSAGTGGAAGSGGSAGSPVDASRDDAGTDASVSDGGGASDGTAVRDGAVTDAGAYVRTGWTAAYTCTNPPCPPPDTGVTENLDPTRAFDGNYQTRWGTGVYQAALKNMSKFPLYFTVDMKQVMNVSKVTMHAGCTDIFDSPGTVEIFLSMDNVFTTAVGPVHTPAVPPNGEVCPPQASAVGTDTITFPQTAARYIQIKGTQRTTSDRWWAIGELNVYP